MKNLKKDLQLLSKSLKAISKTTDRLVKAVDKLEKAQAKAKTTKELPTRRIKGTAKKKPSARRVKSLSATDQVLKIVNRSKKGVNVSTLVKKTGYDTKKVSDIVYRASKQGKIKRAGRGVYTQA
ncbi:MAG: hypothetical protein SWH78_16800 [Thermodesulfobacteriota bacterium]|nr:hypothetical protein [Thermodesulfobacteriota bacterium]